MFKDGCSPVQRLSSPIGRRRVNSSGNKLTNSTIVSSSPQLVRKGNRAQPSPQKSKLISAVTSQKKKKSSPDVVERSFSTSPEPKIMSPFFEEPRQPIHEQVHVHVYVHSNRTCTVHVVVIIGVKVGPK